MPGKIQATSVQHQSCYKIKNSKMHSVLLKKQGLLNRGFAVATECIFSFETHKYRMKSFKEYCEIQEGLWLSDKNALPGMSKLNPQLPMRTPIKPPKPFVPKPPKLVRLKPTTSIGGLLPPADSKQPRRNQPWQKESPWLFFSGRDGNQAYNHSTPPNVTILYKESGFGPGCRTTIPLPTTSQYCTRKVDSRMPSKFEAPFLLEEQNFRLCYFVCSNSL